MYDKILDILRDGLHHGNIDIQDISIVIERPKDRSLGHFSTPLAFSLAKKLKSNPKILAEQIATHLSQMDSFESVSALNGFVNITLKADLLNTLCDEILRDGFKDKVATDKQKVLIEYVSANPTGPLHIGHARGAIYGDSLCRVGRYLGQEIVSEYYVNDNGLQIYNLASSVYYYGRNLYFGDALEEDKITYKGEYVIDIATKVKERFGKDIFKDIKNKKDFDSISEYAKDLMLVEIKENLALLNISFDSFVSEKEMFKNWDNILNTLKLKNGVYEQDNALWLDSIKYGDEKDRVVVRDKVLDNGEIVRDEPTYLAGDIIYHDDKFKRNYDRYINIWGADHHGYIARVKAAIHILGYDENKLEVILSQMVSLLKNGEAYKMSKRSGNFILLKEVVGDIGSDALRFIFLTKRPDTHLEFDVDALKVEDSSNPIFYINYANARIHTLLKKSNISHSDIATSSLNDVDTDILNLLFNAMYLPQIVKIAFRDRELQKITEYLKVLSSDFHSIYNSTKVLGESKEKQLLKVFMLVSLSITKGLSLLGIEAKKQM